MKMKSVCTDCSFYRAECTEIWTETHTLFGDIVGERPYEKHVPEKCAKQKELNNGNGCLLFEKKEKTAEDILRDGLKSKSEKRRTECAKAIVKIEAEKKNRLLRKKTSIQDRDERRQASLRDNAVSWDWY